MIILWKKSLFVFWPSQKNVTGPKWQKWAKNPIWAKYGIFWHGQKRESDFLVKKSLLIFWLSKTNANFNLNWVFGPFLPLWPSDIFLTWSENKKWFFSQNNHFLFTEQSIFMAGKISCSNNPNLFWQILLLRPTVEDFETWVFWTPRGSPLTLR